VAKLVQKSGYIQSGGAGGYMRYIATREGVEKFYGQGAATEAQQQLIANLLRDFPDSEELFEYEDYLAAPTFGTASAFITMALDVNAHTIQSDDGYMKYIATRPRVERHGDHGLFSAAPAVDLNEAMKELHNHEGNVWTIIYSLRREDAARLGYDKADSWQTLLMARQAELAEAMKIPADKFVWYAAFHNEGHHPHIHMMIWSDDPRQGFLTKDGIAAMRSKLTNTIFKDELTELYTRKDISYKEVTEAARQAMEQLVRRMEFTLCDSPVIEQQMTELARQMESVTGKKVYGYLKKPIKAQVDAIVDALAELPEVSQCYEQWNHLRDELQSYYNETTPRQHLPLSQQKEFKKIKNMVIREAENIRLGIPTFEDKGMEDEPDDATTAPGHESRSVYQQAREYRDAKGILYDEQSSTEEKRRALAALENLYGEGYSTAAHLLGKVWRDGTSVLPDQQQAEHWFRLSAEMGNSASEYVLGKLLLGQKRISAAVAWLDRAAAHGNQYARYRLGRLYLLGDNVPKNVERALEYLTASARQGNQYAQYTLGKLYLLGRDIPQNRDVAKEWLACSAAQGNEYAQFFLDRFDQFREPSVLLSATRLLRHMGQIFRDNACPPANPAGIRIDSKRRKKLLEKRLAMGHKADDHEELGWSGIK
jgi:TPR repeat protein